MRPIHEIAQDVHACATSHESAVCLMGNVRADEVAYLAEYAMAASLEPKSSSPMPGEERVGARPWNAMPKVFDIWTVEREIVPTERKNGRSYHADVICEVSPTEPRYGEPARTAEENARRIADALNDAEGWCGPATEAADGFKSGRETPKTRAEVLLDVTSDARPDCIYVTIDRRYGKWEAHPTHADALREARREPGMIDVESYWQRSEAASPDDAMLLKQPAEIVAIDGMPLDVWIAFTDQCVHAFRTMLEGERFVAKSVAEWELAGPYNPPCRERDQTSGQGLASLPVSAPAARPEEPALSKEPK